MIQGYALLLVSILLGWCAGTWISLMQGEPDRPLRHMYAASFIITVLAMISLTYGGITLLSV